MRPSQLFPERSMESAPSILKSQRESGRRLKRWAMSRILRPAGCRAQPNLGLIVSDITNPFFPELIQGFEQEAVRAGFEVLPSSTNYDPAQDAQRFAAWWSARSKVSR